MSVRVSPISRAASILIIALGVLTFFLIDPIAGVAFIVLGIALYLLLYRFARRVEREVEGSKKQPRA